ncbi:fibronectin type III domain-containing protein [Blastococcus sp. CT_GayMR19]|uniref:fibronectin type III domain-containing protein n=1 Tax=Blastococcus sp. CT_GayMR19 TaxID=2559608 RepID=UPI001FD7DEC4|nr:fibronectin type III domain-containing protein [Blastococcus sp. CT_GayMR19]
MTDPIVRIEPTRVKVEPGGQAPVTVTVRNTSDIVEGYRLTVLGSASAWADVVTAKDPGRDESDVVRVYPGQEATATVVFAAPAGSAGTAGEVPFCVLAESVVDPSSSAAAEGDLEIGRVDGLTASITPVTSTGRWSGRHTVKISNWGNSAAKLRLVASDPDDALGYLVSPETLDLPVGSSAVAAVRVRSRRPFLRGTPVRLPFRVVAEPDRPGKVPTANPAVSDPGRPVLDGALNQKPVLTRGTVALGALGVLAAAAAVVVLVTAKPTPPPVPAVSESVAAPQDVTVTPVSATSVEVGWSPFARPPDGIKIFQIDPATKGQQLPVTLEETAVAGSKNREVIPELPPEQEACFEVVAIRGESESVRTSEACATTPAAPVEVTPSEPSPSEPSPSETTPSETSPSVTTPSETGPSGTTPSGTSPSETPPAGLPQFGDQWVLALPFSPDVPGQAQIMATRRELLENAGMTVGELEVSDYPDASQRFRAGWKVLYVGPFASRAEAEAECAASGLDPTLCGTPYQPGDPT